MDLIGKKIAVTGATGFVGSAIVHRLRQKGAQVISLHRRTASPDSIFFELGKPLQPADLKGFDAVVHAAYDFSALTWEQIHQINVQGSLQLFRAAKEARVPHLIFISSISAYEGCQSLYGRGKWEVEEALKTMGGHSLRPGLVWGNSLGGMMGKLEAVVKKIPVIPVMGGNAPMYLCHEEDLSNAIEHIIQAKSQFPAVVIVAHSRPTAFKNILRQLARRQGVQRIFIPIWWRWAWLGLRSMEILGLRLSFRADSLISLMQPNPKPEFLDSAQTDVKFRSWEDPLAKTN